ncbi:MAG: hypothetical protein AAFX58_07195, partial [Pseudomonadota bacterium]
MKFTTNGLTGVLLGALLATASHSAVADDETISAYAGCRAELGNTTGTGSGLRASGGTAVISCPILKNVSPNDLNWVYARINRAQAGGGDPFCSLSSHNAYNTASDSTWVFASDPAGNKSLSLPLPTTYSTGYLTLSCVLNV